MALIIYIIFISLLFSFVFTIAQKSKTTTNKPKVKPTTNSYSRTGHEDHTLPLPHNSQASFNRNNERDTIKDKPLTEAERNVLYGK